MFRFKWHTAMLVLAIVTVAVVGCVGSDPKPEPIPADNLEDVTWILKGYGKSGNLQEVLDGSEITAIFDGDKSQINGSAGCNNYFGSYQVSDDKLTIMDLANTEMSCLEPEGVMEQENQYLRILRTVVGYLVQDGELHINSDDEILIYVTK
jgi:heat shock protein HslJ